MAPESNATTLDSARRNRALFDFYICAKAHVWSSGYWAEILDAEDTSNQPVTSSSFAREMAWVVLNAGFRETVVRRVFNDVSDAFHDWDVEAVASSASRCVRSAKRVFGHLPKLHAIAENCKKVCSSGLEALLAGARTSGPRYFTCLSYVGDVTCYHLAKNIGMETAKPDRHLKRIAQAWGCDPFEMCHALASRSGDSVRIVDLILWRYASVSRGYVEHARQACAQA